jgi:uncharacterized cupin superfamily protein
MNTMMKVWSPTPDEIEKTSDWDIWSKEASEFPWYYDDTETCYILEGEATATDEAGNTITFQAGDMVKFEQGLTCKWKIKKNIKKRYLFG